VSDKPPDKPPAKPAKPAEPRALLTAGVLAAIAAVAALLYWPGLPLPSGAKVDRLVVDKEQHLLLAYSHHRLLKTYRVSLGPASGPKKREGDLRTPEGRYSIDKHNGASAFYMSLHISYPTFADAERARSHGYSPGGAIMIHGLPNGHGWVGRAHLLTDWTAGCIALTDGEIEELYHAVPDGTPIEILP
jgi:murein L,D-transpeptidase YafK